MVANNSIGPGDQEQIDSFTYGLPPVPVINTADIGNVTILVNLLISSVFHDGLAISLEVSTIVYSNIPLNDIMDIE